jgi:hypothetical protein
MVKRGWLWAWVVAASLAGGAVESADRVTRGDADVRELYERLSPGMPLREAATLAGGQLGATAEPVTTWMLWSQAPEGQGTAVLRVAFQDGRISRLEYEWFGSEYRRLAKGADPWVEIPGDEVARIWRQTWQAGRAAETCREALDAYHEVVLGAQERLTPDEQQAWARALQLRRAAEGHLSGPGR